MFIYLIAVIIFVCRLFFIIIWAETNISIYLSISVLFISYSESKLDAEH
jgi:hypothetical protein